MDVFITSFSRHYIKQRKLDSTARRTPKEIFCHVEKVLEQENDTDQVPLPREIPLRTQNLRFRLFLL